MAETKQSIYARLRAAQLELKAPKNEEGRFGKSRSAEAILEAAKPVLERHGLTLVVSDEITLVEDRHYVKATATVYDDAGNTVSASAHAWEGGVDRGLDTSQVTGKTSSYARKYALGGLLAIDDTKDADRDKEAQEAPQKAASAPRKPAVGSAPTHPAEELATPIQKRQIAALMHAFQIGQLGAPKFLEENFGIIPGVAMTKADAANIIKELKSWREDGEPQQEAA